MTDNALADIMDIFQRRIEAEARERNFPKVAFVHGLREGMARGVEFALDAMKDEGYGWRDLQNMPAVIRKFEISTEPTLHISASPSDG